MMGNRLLYIVVLSVGMCGCASQPKIGPVNKADTASQEQMRAVHGDLIEQMIQQENYHAALAHIEELQGRDNRGGDNRLLLLHARVQFKLGRVQEAHAEYSQLLGGPYDAEAMHGLGLVYAEHNPDLALQYLSKASNGRPTDPGIRNDYGYALLRKGDYQQARLNLITAHELAPAETRYRNNAMLAMLVMNDEQAAERLARKSAMPAATLDMIRAQAKRWRQTPEAVNKTAGAINVSATDMTSSRSEK